MMTGMGAGSTLGAVMPMLFGDVSLFDGWSVLGTFTGGIIGIWLGYKVGKALE